VHYVPLLDDRGEIRQILGITHNITQRKRAEEIQQQLLQRLVTAQEEERRRVARELHDEMAQHLTALTVGLKSLQECGQYASPAAECIGQLQAVTNQVMQEVRRLAWELRPAALGQQSLERALRSYAEQWSQRTGAAMDFHSNGLDGLRLAPHLETTMYRIVQEALTNVAKHAQAHRVSILLECRGDHIHAIVEDDGNGFDADALLARPERQGVLGLIGMQERAALVDGSVEIESSPGAGTTVFGRLPLATSTTSTNVTSSAMNSAPVGELQL
jgi:signal transduction histidine kinase